MTQQISKLESLLKMLRMDPANASLRSHCVSSAISVGAFDRAQDLVDARLREAPMDPHALFDSASILIARREYRDAIAQLTALLTNGYRQAGILINLGLCQYCVRDFSSAREPLQAAYEAGDRSAGLLRLLVSTLHHLAMLDDALAVADANADAARNDGALAGVFALLYLDAERPAPAARLARTALQLNPDCIDGLVVEGMLHVTRMRTEEAEREFNRVLELAPTAGRAWLGLGTLALLAKDMQRAKSLITQALEHMGGHVGTYHMLAWTHLASGDLTSAERVFEQALALNRNFAETHGGLATVAAFRGDRAAAERLIAVAERLDPDCSSAKLGRAILAGGSDPALRRKIIAETAGALANNEASALGRVLAAIGQQ